MYIKKVIKKFLPKSLKFKLYSTFGKDYSSQFFDINRPKVFIILAADYGNLGDIAITVAQKNFIKKTLPGHQIIPIDFKDTIKMLKTIRNIIKGDDIITIIGGGNMGDLYEGIESLRRNIILTFPKNKIISFPQTIDFSNTEDGRKSLEKTVKYYNKHLNLHLFARESTSYKIMRREFKNNNNINLVPDIVLSYDFKKANKQLIRNGIIFCLRDDLETKINSDTKNKMISEIKNRYDRVSFMDTHIGRDNDSFNQLEESFQSLLVEFSKTKLVITDRLHGMIFCAITGTPCIVLPNTNHKIVGTYNDWLKDVTYISLITDIKELNLFVEKVNTFLSCDTNNIEIPNLNNHFKKLEETLKI